MKVSKRTPKNGWSTMGDRFGSLFAAAAVSVVLVAASAGSASAQPTVEEIVPPLPPPIPLAGSWQPKFPWPYGETRDDVSPADVNALREMCGWFNAQYDILLDQINNVNAVIASNNGDYNAGNTAQLADALLANIDGSVEYLAPRAQALTVIANFADDLYFPIFQGESFYRLWQQLSNVGQGIRGRQPVWFYGPSLQHAMRWGSKINRSHVCR